MAAVAQIGSLIDFTSGTTIVSSDVDSNYTDIRTAFNNLVTGANAIAIDTVAENTTSNGVVIDGVTLKDSGGTFSGDVIVGNGAGVVIGHTSQLTVVSQLNEFQMHGTTAADTRMVLGRFSANTNAPQLQFLKSRASIGSFATIVVGDVLGLLSFLADDNTDYGTIGAQIIVTSEGTIGSDRIPTKMTFVTGTDASPTVLTTALKLDSSQNATFTGLISVDDTTESTSTVTGSGHFDGGVGIAKDLILGATSTIFIGATANANMTVGTTIELTGADNQAFCVRDTTDVSHGLTSITGTISGGAAVEDGDFCVITKASPGSGGTTLMALHQDDSTGIAFEILAFGGTANTGKTNTTTALIEMHAMEHNGSNALANITANGNVFGVRARVGGAETMIFVVDEDGDIFTTTVVDVTGSGNALPATAFDKYNDAQLVRALEITRTPASVIRSEWDETVRYNEKDLIAADILGGPIDKGGMTNITQLQRLHNGAIWQGYVERQEMNERLEAVERKLLTA